MYVWAIRVSVPFLRINKLYEMHLNEWGEKHQVEGCSTKIHLVHLNQGVKKIFI